MVANRPNIDLFGTQRVSVKGRSIQSIDSQDFFRHPAGPLCKASNTVTRLLQGVHHCECVVYVL